MKHLRLVIWASLIVFIAHPLYAQFKPAWLVATNNLSDLIDKATARVNLQLNQFYAAIDFSNASLPSAQNNLGVPVTVKAYGAKCDGAVFTNDGAISAASNQFTSSNINSLLIGKSILITNAGSTLAAMTYGTGITVVTGGSGYVVNETMPLAGGTGTPSVLKVTAVDGGGGVTAATVQTQGAYTTAPANPVSQASSSGSGTGATFTVAWWGSPLVTTITNVSGNTAILGINATSTVSALSGTNVQWIVGTEDSASIQAAINAAQLRSSGTLNTDVSFAGVGKFCLIATTISVSANGIHLVGNGGGDLTWTQVSASVNNGSSLLVTGNTVLVWVGAPGGTMVAIEPSINSPPLQNGGLAGVGIACMNQAGVGVRIASFRNGEFPNLPIEACTSINLDFEVSPNVSSSLYHADTQYNHFGNLIARAIWPETFNAIGIKWGGISGANTSLNTFDNVQTSTQNNSGLLCQDADSNYVGRFGSATGAGYGLELGAGGAAPGCFSNHFGYVEAAISGVVARGTETGTPASSMNFIANYSTNNGAPAEPTCGTGAGLFWFKPGSNEINTCSSPINMKIGGGIMVGVDNLGGTAGDHFVIYGGNGNNPSLIPVGPDPDINSVFQAKGNGSLWFFSKIIVGAGAAAGANCPSGVTAGTVVTVSGIVTHC